MIAAVMIVLAAAAAAFVLAPLRSPAPPPVRRVERERLLLEREAILRALHDLDLDRATGKISDADYADLASRYRVRAVAALAYASSEQLGSTGSPPSVAATSPQCDIPAGGAPESPGSERQPSERLPRR